MSGKVFAESANIYQDQAKILFDYYQKAAEKIVSEEEKYEKEIASATAYLQQLNKEKSTLGLLANIGFLFGGLLIIMGVLGSVEIFIEQTLGIVLLIVGVAASIFGAINVSKKSKNAVEINSTTEKIAGFEKAYKDIFRDYKVSKLGVGYVPVASTIPFEGKSFLIDYTDSVPEKEFKLQTLRQGELFAAKINELESLLHEIPFVEKSLESESVDTDQYSRSMQKTTYHDYLGNLDRNLRTAAYCLEDLDITAVKLPTILPGSQYASYLDEYATKDTGNAPVFEIFDTKKYRDDLDKFHSLNEMKKSLERHSLQFEEVLKNLMLNMATSVQAITQLKIASSGMLIEQSNKLLFSIFKTSYNHYSPKLEADEIDRIRNESFNYQDSVDNYQPFQLKQSSRVKYDLVARNWVAEDGSKTNYPFGIHQIHEEIVAPIVQNLMQENRIERLKIYNNIKDQKIDYLNKWHQDTEGFYARNRTESNDLINIMRSTLSEYVAAYNAMSSLENTEKSMEKNLSLESGVVTSKNDKAEVIAAFDLKSNEFQKIQTEFVDYMDRLKGDIERRAGKFEFIEYYDASLRDSEPKNLSEATERMHNIEERRKPLIAINPFYAETADLPPAPSVDNVLYEDLSINLGVVARKALAELNNEDRNEPVKPVPPAAGDVNTAADEVNTVEQVTNTVEEENTSGSPVGVDDEQETEHVDAADDEHYENDEHDTSETEDGDKEE